MRPNGAGAPTRAVPGFRRRPAGGLGAAEASVHSMQCVRHRAEVVRVLDHRSALTPFFSVTRTCRFCLRHALLACRACAARMPLRCRPFVAHMPRSSNNRVPLARSGVARTSRMGKMAKVKCAPQRRLVRRRASGGPPIAGGWLFTWTLGSVRDFPPIASSRRGLSLTALVRSMVSSPPLGASGGSALRVSLRGRPKVAPDAQMSAPSETGRSGLCASGHTSCFWPRSRFWTGAMGALRTPRAPVQGPLETPPISGRSRLRLAL